MLDRATRNQHVGSSNIYRLAGPLERPLVGCGRGDRAKSDAANTVKTRD